jgi:hypothetical protein
MADGNKNSGEPAAAGTRVRQTGIALVHEGELILPAAGSEADLEPSRGEGTGTAQYVFPVEVEVLAPPRSLDVQEIVDATLSQLHRSIEAL